MKSDSELLGGNFKLGRLLGTGGMGAVWLAEDVGLQRQVAVKLLAEKLCHDPDLVERFLREARLMARVDHPNVVPVHFVGRWNHVPFIVMKHLTGRPLAEHAEGRPLTLVDIASIARQVCAGLSALHAQGIVHRDIKPANLFVTDEGRVVLLDLGVARDSNSRLTHTGALIGTPRYMAPEQIHGERVDGSADVYALGVVLYELFAGRPMFDVSSSDSLLRAHVYAAPEPLTNVPQPVWAVLEKALRKDPAERIRTPGELTAALEAAVAAVGSAGAVPATWIPAWSTKRSASGVELEATFPSAVRRRRAPLLIALASTVAAVGLGVLWVTREPPAPPTLPVATVTKVSAPLAPEASPLAPSPPATVDAGAAPPPRVTGRQPAKASPPPEEPPPLLPR